MSFTRSGKFLDIVSLNPECSPALFLLSSQTPVIWKHIVCYSPIVPEALCNIFQSSFSQIVRIRNFYVLSSCLLIHSFVPSILMLSSFNDFFFYFHYCVVLILKLSFSSIYLLFFNLFVWSMFVIAHWSLFMMAALKSASCWSWYQLIVPSYSSWDFLGS